MKLIVAIVRDVDVEAVIAALLGLGFGVTRFASTGGFLRRGSTTLLVGAESGRVEEAIAAMRQACSLAESPDQRRVTLFVLPVERFEQL
ncbi:MAG: hypothetical protein A2Y93_13610 [Chloroflexi bacterium RBG_13_68_17]|nr:MAG: hypothetical protein A2Y93_13610 [Chloroflexi bacterium RBG_13_68_17]